MKSNDEPRLILICGATGTLGQALAQACAHRGLAFVLTARADMDLTDAGSIAAALDAHRPWAVINAAGYVRVDDAQAEPDACMAANATGAVLLATACAAREIATLGFSSDLVFDGRAGRAYLETDAPSPLGVYGASKAEAETGLARLDGTHLVVRTAAFFSPFDEHNFAVAVVRELSAGRRFRAASDAVVSPTYVPHLVAAVLDLLIDGASGIWHLTNGTPLAWADFADAIARVCGLDRALIDAVPAADMGWTARRPPFAALDTLRGALLPPLDEALRQFADEVARDAARQRAAA